MVISNKTIMYELLQAGKLGNTLESYDNWPEFLQRTKWRGKVGIREQRVGGIFKADVKSACVPWTLNEYFKDTKVNISQTISKEDYVIHFEILNDYVQYSTKQLYYREAMKTFDVNNGILHGRSLLRHYMDNSSYENVLHLQDLYSDHVIECTVTSKPYGIYKWNTIFWEVRYY